MSWTARRTKIPATSMAVASICSSTSLRNVSLSLFRISVSLHASDPDMPVIFSLMLSALQGVLQAFGFLCSMIAASSVGFDFLLGLFSCFPFCRFIIIFGKSEISQQRFFFFLSDFSKNPRHSVNHVFS